MEETPNTVPDSKLDRFRQWVQVLARGIFSAPYLPMAMTVFFVVTALTHLAVILMNQPPAYWHNSQETAGFDLFGNPLHTGPVGLIGMFIVYLIVALLLLNFVHYRWSLIGWMVAEYSHFFFIQQMMQGCQVSRWSVALNDVCWAFGGEISFASFLFTILLGVVLVLNFQPGGVTLANKKMERGLSWGAGLASLGWILLAVGGVIISLQTPSYGWLPVETKTTPGPLQEAKGAYDWKRNRFVMFGGVSAYLGNDRWDFKNDTWEFDGTDWTRVPAEVSPEGRSKPGLAYDANRGVTVLFGGIGRDGLLGDTWEWDGKTWTEHCPCADQPVARYGHEMVYDAARKKVILYGGYDNKTFYSDAWEWDGETWSKIELQSEPPVASVYALSYNPDENYAFGMLSGYPGGTWKWAGDTWTKLNLTPEPSNRGWTGLAYDPNRKVFVTFGGVSNDNVMDETWLFDGQQWSRFTESGLQPEMRSDLIIWYDPVRKHVMIYGGHHGSKVLSDMWELILPE